jgi:hypothetical protein
MLIAYRASPLYLLGALYFIAACYLIFFAVVLVSGLRKKQRNGDPEPAAWAIQTQASVLTLCGWQVAVGMLNIWQSDFWISIIRHHRLPADNSLRRRMVQVGADGRQLATGSRIQTLQLFWPPETAMDVFWRLPLYSDYSAHPNERGMVRC